MKDTSREDLEDDLRPEYDLERLQLRRVGPGREASDGPIVQLDPDVVEIFPNSPAVNEALRFLIRVARSNGLPQG